MNWNGKLPNWLLFQLFPVKTEEKSWMTMNDNCWREEHIHWIGYGSNTVAEVASQVTRGHKRSPFDKNGVTCRHVHILLAENHQKKMASFNFMWLCDENSKWITQNSQNWIKQAEILHLKLEKVFGQFFPRQSAK